MKKLLILLLVLGITSLASATTVSLTAQGTTIVVPVNTKVFLTISSDAGTGGNLGILAFDAVITVSGTPDIISDGMDALDADYQTTYSWDPTMPCYIIGQGTSSVEIGGGNFGGNMLPIVGWVEVDYQGGTQLVSIAGGVAHGGHGDVMMNPLSFNPGVVTIIPEPMTIALLGLGGLFLLRRRK